MAARHVLKGIPVLAAAAGLHVSQAHASDLNFGTLFGSHGVLQRDAVVPIWGDARPHAHIRVSIAGNTAEADAGAQGHWRLQLPPMPAGGPWQLVAQDNTGQTTALDDVMVGDVWLCGGQSNMEFSLGAATNAWNELQGSANNALRFVNVPRAEAAEPQRRLATPITWNVVSPATAGQASAVCYHMAKALQAAQHVTIGFVDADWGGTAAQGWIAEDQLARIAEFRPGLDQVHRHGANPADPAWQAIEHPPWRASDFNLAVLYNGMIAPLAPFRFRGAAWYQGESNWREPQQYADLLPMLIANWRATFETPDLPFLVVQLPNFGTPPINPGESSWPTLRNIQRTVAETVPHVGLAITLDAGDRLDIHPTQKSIVGQRLAQAARAVAYGENLPTAARPIAVERRGADLVIRFSGTGGDLKTYGGDHALGFETCAAAGPCQWADARADHETVVLPGSNRPDVVRVRYAWADAPIVNLFAGNDWPIGTFELPAP